MNAHPISRFRRGVSPFGRLALVLGTIVGAACSDDSRTPLPTAVAPPQDPAFAKNVSGSKQRILFASDRDGNIEIYSMNTDGSGATRLTNHPGSDLGAVWSPDGKRIAFASTRDNPAGEVYVMNADGTGVIRLTTTLGSGRPSWSKDGKRIVFTRVFDGADPANLTEEMLEIYTMNADGSGQTRLTFNNVRDAFPVWAPDGRRIAFVSSRDHSSGDATDLYVMNADGSGVSRLTSQDGSVEMPSWDPHSTRIAFSTSFATTNGVFVINVDDRALTRLTFTASGQDQWPTWSPDGRKLAFTSARDGNTEIYSMNADGTGHTRLTNTTSNQGFPRWSR